MTDSVHGSEMSVEARLVTLGALAFSALTGAFVTKGASRTVVALGGTVMCAGAAYALFWPAKKGSKS